MRVTLEDVDVVSVLVTLDAYLDGRVIAMTAPRLRRIKRAMRALRAAREEERNPQPARRRRR